ncbi:extracellular sulfatase Sulf-1-like [Diadema setosum]|uniref:extracellular sulfatase Sulf-1-like n=1 Tax=Diadema setosum TaxID=31175 RepID=UPI003B3BD63F
MMHRNRLLLLMTTLLCLMVWAVEGRQRTQTKAKSRTRGHQRSSYLPSSGSRKPNIILILTDDQDVILGSMTAMNKTRYHLGSQGAEFTNAFVTTPMCCPSRSSILTGQYVHNHQVFSNIQEYCGSDQWRMGPELANFGTYLQSANYRTGYFGKYLNEYRGNYIPPGWVEWVGLVKNSKFYNYTLCRNGQLMRHGANYYRDYLPDVIANDSIAFFKLSKRAYPRLPVAMVLSFPSPHGPEDGAPQYQHMFAGNRLHRTPAWNYGPNDDKHWIIRRAEQLTDVEKDFTDALQRKRLITLLSVDDAIEKLCRELDLLGELDNTYILMTSDHGYHLGQLNMVKGKSNAYDTDIRVPFYIRGPEIPEGIQVPNIVLNIDLAPTILHMAGVSIPPHMDGMSIMKLFKPASNYKVARKSKKWKYVGKEPWRESFLVEKTRSPDEMRQYMQRVNRPSKADLMEEQCRDPSLHPPCTLGQAKVCVREADDSLHMRKCRIKHKDQCECAPPPLAVKANSEMSRSERRQQRKFLKKHTGASGQGNFKAKSFLRGKREVSYETSNEVMLLNNEVIDNAGLDAMCQILANETIICDNEVFASRQAWREHKKSVENQLRYLRRYMGKLKEIKTFLKHFRPDKELLDSLPKGEPTYSVEIPENLMPSIGSEEPESSEATSSMTSEAPVQSEGNSSSIPTGSTEPGDSLEESEDEGMHVVMATVEMEETEQESIDRTRDQNEDKQSYTGTMIGGECICEETEVVEMDMDDLELEVPLIEMGSEHFDPEEEDDDDGEDYVRAQDDEEEDQVEVNEFLQSPLLEMQRDDQNQVLRKSHKKAKARAKAKKLKLKDRMKSRKPCHLRGLSCFYHDNDHWKTPPYWTQGAICACLNTRNNSYYCVRTINKTHNFLYCEFVTNFREYFDMRPHVDPHQLTNKASSLDPSIQTELHIQIDDFRTCRGRRCHPSGRRRKSSKKSSDVSHQPTSLWQTLPQTSSRELWDGWVG